ncbi:MAG: oligopeptide/dipeptide ABC transporter ATP-binding protein [Pseudomonadota bacterium]
MALLEAQNLTVRFGSFHAVSGSSFTIDQGEVLGIVGESGSGKSVSMLALMGLIPFPGEVTADRLAFDGHDILTMRPRKRREITGKDVAMIFQEPMTSLNPCFTVGFQLVEALRVHQGGRRRELREQAIALLDEVGIPDPKKRIGNFPHQMSGGMNQRVMIAMAIACRPKLLIADEPTTALDVTIQAQILDLLLRLQQDQGMALILITHDMGVVAETAQRVNVMYAGELVEERNVEQLFSNPRHPYTSALLEALPERAAGRKRLPTIPGVVPGPFDRPHGCLFNPRCSRADAECHVGHPQLTDDSNGRVRCFHPIDAEETVPA